MPFVNLQYVVSFTSEDPKNCIQNLLTNKGKWLCSAEEKLKSISAVFQLEKASLIDYVDLGNSYSATVRIDVGMSSWPTNKDFVSLLPTVVLMGPADCKIGANSTSVRMFKKENMDGDTLSKKWDRLKVTCCQPFLRSGQFGLSFIKVFSQEERNPARVDIITLADDSKTDSMISQIRPKNTSVKTMSSSLQLLEHSRAPSSDEGVRCETARPISNLSSPISRAAQVVMAHRHLPNNTDALKRNKDLELDALNFIIALNLSVNDIRSLKVSHIREQYESTKQRRLTANERLVFKEIALDYSAKKLESEAARERDKNDTVDFVLLSSDEDERTISVPSCSKRVFGDTLRVSSTKRMMDENPNEVSSSASKFVFKSSCPICLCLFNRDEIEEHASTCEGFPEPLSSVENHPIIAENKDKISCPICNQSFSSSEYPTHVQKCAEDAFS